MLPQRLELFVEPIIAMCQSQFPRSCGTCQRRFDGLEQWVLETDPIGVPTMDEWIEADPFGMISWVNCTCRNTLVLECEDMKKHRQFTQALADESAASGRSVSDLLQDLRRAIRQRIVRDVEP